MPFLGSLVTMSDRRNSQHTAADLSDHSATVLYASAPAPAPSDGRRSGGSAVRFQIIRNARTSYVGQYQSCMVSRLRMMWKRLQGSVVLPDPFQVMMATSSESQCRNIVLLVPTYHMLDILPGASPANHSRCPLHALALKIYTAQMANARTHARTQIRVFC